MPQQLKVPEGAMDFVKTRNIAQTHQTDDHGILWETPKIIDTTAAVADERRNEIMRRFDAAEAIAQSGDWTRAAESFLQLVEEFPTFGPGYVALASAAFAISEMDVGLAALEHAQTVYPENIDILLQLGVVLAHTGEHEKAQAKFLRALEIDEDNIDALVSLAHMCRVAKHYVEAVQLIDQANKLDPTNPIVIGAVGTLALELGDREGAETALNHLKERHPEHHETTILSDRLTGLAEDAAQ
jgi:tetratricopeptide (TPR) repeat protein